jgi:Tol biopolymer transport system component
LSFFFFTLQYQPQGTAFRKKGNNMQRNTLIIIALLMTLSLIGCGGGAPEKKRDDGIYATARPSVTPDGQRIIFAAVRDGKSGVYSMNLDGSKILKVNAFKGEAHSPAYSANGKYLAAVIDQSGDGRGQIAIIKTLNQQLTIMPHPPETYDRHPAFTPNGRFLIFQRSEKLPTAQEFWLYDMETSTSRLIRNDDAWRPTLHHALADNKQILFAQMEKITWQGKKSFRYQPYTLTLNSGKLTRLGVPGRTHPCLTPDGKNLLFIGEGGKGNVIYRADRKGNNPRQLYGSRLNLRTLMPAPNNRHLLFLQQKESFSAFYRIMRLHLVTGDVNEIKPAWNN